MNILIADDHQLYRDALSLLIKQISASAKVKCVNDFSQLKQQIDVTDWDAILIDLNMPYLDGWQEIKTLIQTTPNTSIIVITSSEDPNDTRRALEVGALGYIVKSMNSDDIHKSLKLMLQNGMSIHPVTNNKVTLNPTNKNNGFDELTPRQYEVLKHICKGSPNKRIALDLELSESTVKLHVRAILRALSVSNRTEAALIAKQQLDFS